MPRKKKTACSVILFDVNADEDFKKEALRSYVEICAGKFFSGSEDLTKLILINTRETSNTEAEENPETFRHIVEATDMVFYDPENKRHIEEAQPCPGNWLEGILLGIRELKLKSDAEEAYTLQLLLFSDLKTPPNISKDALEDMKNSIITDICNYYIYFMILGPEVEMIKMICSKGDIYWIDKLSFKSPTDDENYSIAKEIALASMGVLCSLDVGVELFDVYKESKDRQPWLIPLKFGNLEIPSVVSKLIENVSLIKPKLGSKQYVETIHVDAEEGTLVDSNDVIGGVALHGKLIIIPKDVDKGIKQYERFFKLIGFTDAANIPEHYMKASSTNQMYVDEERDPNAKALRFLIMAASKLGKYGVALKAHMKNCRPKLYCLIPEPELDPPSFIMVELPYAEEINIRHSETNVKEETKKFIDDSKGDELKNNIYGFLDSIGMEGKVKLHPNLRKNVCQKSMFNKLTAKYLGGEITETKLPLGELKITPTPEIYCEKLKMNWNGSDVTNPK